MIQRIETMGSIFEIDEDDLRYRRFPKHEGPREKPEWSDERAGALQDAVWHPYIEWEFEPAWDYMSKALIITFGHNDNGDRLAVSAPRARLIG